MPGQLSPVMLPPARLPIIATPTSGSDWLSAACGVVDGVGNDDTVINARLAQDGFVQLAPGTYTTWAAPLGPPLTGGGIVGSGRSTILRRPSGVNVRQVSRNGGANYYFGHFSLDGNQAGNVGAGHYADAFNLSNATDFTVEDIYGYNTSAQGLGGGGNDSERATFEFNGCSDFFTDKLKVYNTWSCGVRYVTCSFFDIGLVSVRGCREWGIDFDAGCNIGNCSGLRAYGCTKDGVLIEQYAHDLNIGTIHAMNNRTGVSINQQSAGSIWSLVIDRIVAKLNMQNGVQVQANAADAHIIDLVIGDLLAMNNWTDHVTYPTGSGLDLHADPTLGTPLATITTMVVGTVRAGDDRGTPTQQYGINIRNPGIDVLVNSADTRGNLTGGINNLSGGTALLGTVR